MNKTFLPEDLVPNSFIDQFGSLIKCALGGWDRLRFPASLRPLFSPQWLRTYLCAAKVRLVDFRTHARALTRRLCQEGQNLAKAAQRPYHFLRSSQITKEDFIEDLARRDQVHAGLIAVLGAVEPCLAMTVRGARDRRWLEPRREERKCLHLYAITTSIRCWAAAQLQTNWLSLLNELLEPVHPLQKEILKPFPNLYYYWTATQSEYATDLARAYRAFVLHGLCTFQSPDVMRFLGHKVPVSTGQVDARFQGEVHSDVLTRHEGVCLKHHAGFNSQKAYDKFWNLLRVENTINRPEAFTVYRADPVPPHPRSWPPTPRTSTTVPPLNPPPDPKVPLSNRVPELKPRRAWQPLRRSVTDLPRRAEVSRAANRRYLDALASTQVGTPLGPAAAPLGRPLTKQGRRYRPLHPFGADADLLRALSRGEWVIGGFRNQDLQRLLYPGEPHDKKAARRRSATTGRKLRLLRAQGLIRKLPHTHRYLLTQSGRSILTALSAAYEASTQKLTLAMAA